MPAYEGPQTWTAADFGDPRDWRVDLSPATLDELERALGNLRGRDIAGLRRCDCVLPSFAETARRLRQTLREGRGFAVLRGFPVDRHSEEESRLLYAILGLQLGTILPQTVRGDLLYSVRDEGLRLENDYGRPGVRISKTAGAFVYHTDSPSALAGHTPDVVGLLVLRTAKSGGESALVSGYAVHQMLRTEYPRHWQRLHRPFWVDRRAELPPGEVPVRRVPVFADNGRLVVRYLRFYIVKGQELRGEPLSPDDEAALDALDEMTHRPGVALSMPLDRGDIQLIDNTFLLHSRAAYEDHADPALKRHYVRLWLAMEAANEGTGYNGLKPRE